jgi:hypothetical protein
MQLDRRHGGDSPSCNAVSTLVNHKAPLSPCWLFSSASGRSILLQTIGIVVSALKRCTFTVIKFLHFSPSILSLLVLNSSPHSCLTFPYFCTLLLLQFKETHMHFLVETGGMSLCRRRSLLLFS